MPASTSVPMDCITVHGTRPGGRAAQPPAGARPSITRQDPLRLGRAEDRTHHGQGRGRLPALRSVRGALPDRRLGHAEVPAGDGQAGHACHAR
jgi:hypothetical protein